jgi:hypothetical protein
MPQVCFLQQGKGQVLGKPVRDTGIEMTSFKEANAAIVMLSNLEAGDQMGITSELIEMGGTGLHKALWRCLT